MKNNKPRQIVAEIFCEDTYANATEVFQSSSFDQESESV